MTHVICMYVCVYEHMAISMFCKRVHDEDEQAIVAGHLSVC